MDPSVASGSRMKRGEWMTLMVSCAGEAGRDQLASAGEAEHEVLLDEAEGDVQVGVEEALVDIDGCAARGGAEAAMGGEVAGIVVDDADSARRCPGQGCVEDLSVGGGAVQAGGDEDGDAFLRYSGGVEAREQRGQSDGVRRRAGDVADADGGGALAAGEFRERRAGDGMVESLGKCSIDSSDWRSRARFEK